jgi:hypothetical protein
MTEVNKLEAIKFRLECLKAEHKKVDNWTKRRKFDNFQGKKVWVTSQKTRNFWNQLKFYNLEVIGLLENIIQVIEEEL